jgi:hypothetical protein
MKEIGRIDRIDFPEFGLENIEVKIDTGANRSSIHCTKIDHQIREGEDCIAFQIPLTSHENDVFYSNDYFKKKIKSSSGHIEDRYIIKTTAIIFGKKIHTSFSLTDRAEMKFPILLGRKLLKSRFIVDVAQEDLSYKTKTKIKPL